MDTLTARLAAALEATPTWRPEASEDSWENVSRLRARSAVQALLVRDFLLGVDGAYHEGLAHHFAAKSYLTEEAAQHMAERLGGAL